MIRQQSAQYTVRRVPAQIDKALRRRAREEGKSLNEIALEALRAAAGLSDKPIQHHDLDSIAGTWVEDPEFDAAVAEQDRVDPDLWK